MSDKEINEIQSMLYQVLQRLTVVETKIDSYNNLREKLNMTYSITLSNKEDIDEIKENRKWLQRTSVGALITSTITIILGMIFAFLKLK